jgi:hypothetical protein
MGEWIESRIVASPTIVTNEEELVNLIAEKPNVYCLCASDKRADDEALFRALVKELPFISRLSINTDFCVIKN